MPSQQQSNKEQTRGGTTITPRRTILVVGACALDRILHLESYPTQDSKTRCRQTFEYGGGNAANTASAMARLVDAKFLQGGGPNRIDDDDDDDGGAIGGSHSSDDQGGNADGNNDGDNNGNEDNVGPITIKLLSKIGNDPVQKQICCELEQCGVDLSSPLFQIAGGQTSSTRTSTRTPIATVIVTTIEPHSRTCIYDPGTCGELTAADVNHVLKQESMLMDLNDMFDNVIHFHSDSRHTEAAALLAREAKRRGIPVSVDVERDRHSKAFDELIDSASIIFTNENKMSCTLERRKLVIPVVVDGGGETILMERGGGKDEHLIHANQKGDLADAAALCYALESMSMNKASADVLDASRSRQVKELVVTLGSKGSVQCKHLDQSGPESSDISQSLDGTLRKSQTNEEGALIYSIANSNYQLHCAGKPRNVKVIDTTGAGDAFIGGYILSNISIQSNEYHGLNKTKFCLHFGSWVAGKKIMGPGARSALPSGREVDEELGSDVFQIMDSLQDKVETFDID